MKHASALAAGITGASKMSVLIAMATSTPSQSTDPALTALGSSPLSDSGDSNKRAQPRFGRWHTTVQL